jgi:hypothetical protein
LKKRLSKLAYAQEYLAIFTDELKRIFDDELLKEVCVLKQTEVRIETFAKKYLGVDVAGFGDDECTYEGLQELAKEKLVQIDHIVEKRNYTTDTSKRIIGLDKLRNYSEIGVDDGGVGFGVYCELMQHSRTKRRTIALNNATRWTDAEGTKSKKILKEDMYINLLILMENKKIKLFDNEEIKLSLESMQYDEDGKIFGSYSHIAEGIVRAAWMATQNKSLNIFVHAY